MARSAGFSFFQCFPLFVFIKSNTYVLKIKEIANQNDYTLTDTNMSRSYILKTKPCKAFMNETTTSDNTVKMVLLTRGFDDYSLYLQYFT